MSKHYDTLFGEIKRLMNDRDKWKNHTSKITVGSDFIRRESLERALKEYSVIERSTHKTNLCFMCTHDDPDMPYCEYVKVCGNKYECWQFDEARFAEVGEK